MRAEFNFVRKSSGSEHSRHILTRMDQTFNKKKKKKMIIIIRKKKKTNRDGSAEVSVAKEVSS